MPLNAFIVRPFGVKELIVSASNLPERIKAIPIDETGILHKLSQMDESSHWKVAVNFDKVHELLIAPALNRLNIRGETASAVVVAGNIREDMFHRLITADVVIADLSIHNANVFYELGIRQAFRDKYTFLIRSNLSEYPFDLKTDRYFDYDLVDLLENSEQTIEKLAEGLRGTIMSNKADSPVFKLLPKLEAEDRSRFISVPEGFREEVERARYLRLPEHLSILAVECADSLWEAEGLREVGRAQFEANFIDDAKATWELIVNRYPDDIEANTTLSTIYQRRNDAPRSEQALARVSRMGTLTANRQSQLRSLNGRNLKEAWIKQWHSFSSGLERQTQALSSPLLQRAYEAFEESFKADLNNAYAGLNALTLLVIQTELAIKLPDVWQRIQPCLIDAEAEQAQRYDRIGQLIATLELAVEAERDRLRREATIDPWFNLLAASVACIISSQPEYVAKLYADARHFAPVDSEISMCRALTVYQQLEINGGVARNKSVVEAIPVVNGARIVGTIGDNVAKAMSILSCADIKRPRSKERQRILMFAGLRLSIQPDYSSKRCGFPKECVDEAKELIRSAVKEEMGIGDNDPSGHKEVVFGMAAGAHGGDLLFHEVCHELKLPTRLCLALPRAEYVGRYVAPAGPEWVDRFSKIYRQIDEMRHDPQAKQDDNIQTWDINCFTDSSELPRWLQGRPHYNVGRRNNLWMLRHAIVAANQLGENTEITLIVLSDNQSELGIGGIGHLAEQALMAGVKVKKICLRERKHPKSDSNPFNFGENDIHKAEMLSQEQKFQPAPDKKQVVRNSNSEKLTKTENLPT